MMMMKMMIKMKMARIVTVYNLTDKVHANGHARGEEQTQLLQNQDLWGLLKVLERTYFWIQR